MFKILNISILFILFFWMSIANASIDSTYFSLLDSANKYTTFSPEDQLKAEKYYDQAFLKISQFEGPQEIAEFYYRKSKLELYSGNTLLGVRLCMLALSELKNERTSLLYFKIKHRLGNAYYSENKYNKAINEYLDVIYKVKDISTLNEKDAKELKNIEAYSYTNIAGINYVLFAEKNAIEYYKKSANLFLELENETMLKYCYFSMAAAYIDIGDLEKAKEQIDIGFKMVDQNEKSIDLGDFYLTNSYYFLKTGKFDSVKVYIDLAHEIFSNYEDEVSINKANIFKGDYYYNLNEFNKSIEILEAGYQNLNHSNSDRLQLKVELLLAKNYAKTQQYQKAYFYIDKALNSHEKILHNHEEFFAFEFDNRIKVNQMYFRDSIRTISNNLKFNKIESDLKEKSILNQFLFFAVLIFLLITVGLFYIVNRNMKVNKRLKRSINENKILFNEVHHRVKNNFQIISSLMNLQKMAVDEPKVDSILNETQQRINSMSLVHELLYKHDEVDKIDISEYVLELVDSIEKSYNNAKKTIRYHIEMNSTELILEKAIPLGLILNEAITNAMKHAFTDIDEGDIWIEMTEISERQLQLIVKDNGVGIAGDSYRSDNSLGLDLIEILSEQLDGTSDIRNEGGMIVKILFDK